jgi:2,4-dienoyl-CoA reductase-like NADH-dependent reductase (Old Yellow Enzyme family)
MSDRYPHVFSPIRIGPVDVPNRFYLGSHSNPLAAPGVHGSAVPSEAFARYYGERAAAGVGLLIHSLPVLPRFGRQTPYYEESVASFRAVATHIHRYGAKLLGQLWYYWGSPGPWGPATPPAPSIGASAVQRFDDYTVIHELTTAEIKRLVEGYARGARHLREAGYDGVEIHSAHGIVVEHFLSPYFNKRTDEYGGDFDGRIRLLVEVLTAVREESGPGMAVGLRLNCEEMVPGGLTQDDAKAVLARLCELGLIDFADLDIGIEPNQFFLVSATAFVPPLLNESIVANVRTAVAPGVAVLSVLGRVTDVAEAERVIEAGTADMVGAVRPLLAEPEMIKNAREGREDRSRTCIACNYCLAYSHIGSAFGCAINPASARETRWGVATLRPGSRSVNVVVVGGGPAGLEAARVTARLGHRVTLFERRAQLGGQVGLWRQLPDRQLVGAQIDWYERQLEEHGVTVRKGVDATAETVLAENPDAVVVASGARYARDGESGFLSQPIPGTDRDFVLTPEQVIEGGNRPQGRVLILDEEGIHTAAGIAELLANGGAEVEVVSRNMQPAQNLFWTFEFVTVVAKLKSLGINLNQGTYVQEIGDHRVTVYDIFTNAPEVREGVDAVVLATMRRPESGLARGLEGKVSQLFVVGDALAPRGLADAIFDGHRFARMVGDPGAPASFADDYFGAIPDEAFAGMRPAAAMLLEAEPVS